MSREDAVCDSCVERLRGDAWVAFRLTMALLHLVAAALVELTAKPQEYESSFDYEVDLVAGYMRAMGLCDYDIYDTYDVIQHAVDREQRLGRL